MKADSSGTYTEQQRARMGWKTLKSRRQCSNCDSAIQSHPNGMSVRWNCGIGEFETRSTAVCEKWNGEI